MEDVVKPMELIVKTDGERCTTIIVHIVNRKRSKTNGNVVKYLSNVIRENQIVIREHQIVIRENQTVLPGKPKTLLKQALSSKENQKVLPGKPKTVIKQATSSIP